VKDQVSQSGTERRKVLIDLLRKPDPGAPE
jgi:hypothetical protein